MRGDQSDGGRCDWSAVRSSRWRPWPCSPAARAGGAGGRRARRGPSPSRSLPSPRPSTPPSRSPGPGTACWSSSTRACSSTGGTRPSWRRRSRSRGRWLPTARAIELKLRPNVKFHDGSTLDAETVKASIDRTKAVNRGGAFFLQTLKEVQVVDRMTVRLVALQPSVSLLYGLPKVFITGKAHLADADRGAAFFATGGNGTGPYRLTRWEKGQQIVLDHFPDYWRGWAGNHAAQVIQRVVPAAGTQQLLLERGDAHLVVLASIGITQDPKELAAKPGVKMVESPAYPGDRHLHEHPEGPAQGRPPPQGAPGRLRLRGHGAGLQGVRRGPEQPDPQGLHGRVRAGPPAVQAGRGAGQAAPRRGRLPGQAARPCRSSTPRPSRRRAWPAS